MNKQLFWSSVEQLAGGLFHLPSYKSRTKLAGILNKLNIYFGLLDDALR